MKAFIFDLDGTLVDSVYLHTLAWQETLNEVDLRVAAWQIHRHIGISGKLLVKLLARERALTFSDEAINSLEERHDAIFKRYAALQRPLPGAVDLLKFLSKNNISHGLATTGKRLAIQVALDALEIGEDTVVVDGSSTSHAKPEPDLFVTCQERLDVEKSDCLVVGDAIWDIHAARRAGILSVGLLTGGFGEQELYNAGAMHVYRDAAQLNDAIDELGFQLT